MSVSFSRHQRDRHRPAPRRRWQDPLAKPGDPLDGMSYCGGVFRAHHRSGRVQVSDDGVTWRDEVKS